MKKLISASTLVLLGLLILPFSSAAETMTYDHDGEPLLAITFPDAWMVDTDYIAEAKAAGTYEGGEPKIRIVEAIVDSLRPAGS